jgi:hypothetical protein
VKGGVRYSGKSKELSVMSDAQGKFRLTAESAGMYWLNVNYPIRGQEDSAKTQSSNQQAHQRYAYGATIEVLPE